LFDAVNLSFTTDEGLDESQLLGRKLIQPAQGEVAFDAGIAIATMEPGNRETLTANRTQANYRIHMKLTPWLTIRRSVDPDRK
jgi:hypothetical protein